MNHASAPSTREPLLHQRVQRRVIVKLFAALVAIQNYQRHAPIPLPRDAPVRPLRDHRVNPFSAPFRRPFHLGDFRKRARPDRTRTAPRAIQIDEPLFGGAENYRIVAPPAVRIAVRKFLFAEQRAAIAQQRHDDGIRLKHGLAFVFRQAFEIAAVSIDRRVRLNAIFLPGLKVLHAVARRGVHDAGALIERHVIGQNRWDSQIQKRMPEFQLRQIFPFPRPAHASCFKLQSIERRADQIRREQQRSRGSFGHDVIVVRMKRERAIVRQRPGSGRPDHGTHARAEFFRRRTWLDGKFHPDRRAGVIFVFHLCFGERGGIHDAPIHGLQPAIHVSFFEKRDEGVGDRGFVLRTHRQIRVFPLPEHTEALEIPPVLIHVARSEFAAHAPELAGRDASLFSAEFFFHLRFDRQSVAIPSGNVRRAKARHRFRLHNHVFQNFIQPGAEMNRPGRIGRPVMQDVRRRAGASLLDAMIEFLLFPLRKLLRLVLRQAGLHRKGRARQIQCAFQVNVFGHKLASSADCPYHTERPSSTGTSTPAEKPAGLGKDSFFLYRCACTA